MWICWKCLFLVATTCKVQTQQRFRLCVNVRQLNLTSLLLSSSKSQCDLLVLLSFHCVLNHIKLPDSSVPCCLITVIVGVSLGFTDGNFLSGTKLPCLLKFLINGNCWRSVGCEEKVGDKWILNNCCVNREAHRLSTRRKENENRLLLFCFCLEHF